MCASVGVEPRASLVWSWSGGVSDVCASRVGLDLDFGEGVLRGEETERPLLVGLREIPNKPLVCLHRLFGSNLNLFFKETTSFINSKTNTLS